MVAPVGGSLAGSTSIFAKVASRVASVVTSVKNFIILANLNLALSMKSYFARNKLAWQFVTLATIVFTARPLAPKKFVSLVFKRVSSADRAAGVKLGSGVIMSVAAFLV